jgi:hypothetical protein
MNKNILYLFVVANPNFMVVAEACEDLEQKSCWQVVNQTSSPILLSCGTDEMPVILAITSLKTASTFSHDFFRDADFHRGFLQPNVTIACMIKVDKKKIYFTFTTIDSGDRIKFLIDDHQIAIEVHQYWSFRKIKRETIFYRGP